MYQSRIADLFLVLSIAYLFVAAIKGISYIPSLTMAIIYSGMKICSKMK